MAELTIRIGLPRPLRDRSAIKWLRQLQRAKLLLSMGILYPDIWNVGAMENGLAIRVDRVWPISHPRRATGNGQALLEFYRRDWRKHRQFAQVCHHGRLAFQKL